MSRTAAKEQPRTGANVQTARVDFLPQGFAGIHERLLFSITQGQAAESIVDQAAQLIEDAIPGSTCLIEFIDEGAGALRSSTLADDGATSRFGIAASPQTALGMAFGSGKQVEVGSFVRESAWAAHGLRAVSAGYASTMALPLIRASDRKIVGAMALYFDREEGCTPVIVDHLASLAAIVAALPELVGPRNNAAQGDGFSELASTIPGVVYQRVVRPDGDIRYTYISEGAKNLFGVDAETIIRDPQALFNHYGAEYRASFRQKLIEASKDLRTWDVEAQILRPDGTIRYTHAIANPRREADGSVVWTGVILDASRMKLAELEAAETESRTRDAIVESFTQGLLLYGPDGKLVVRNSKFLDVNPGLEKVAVPGALYIDVLKAELDPSAPGRIMETEPLAEFSERIAAHKRGQGSVVERQISGDRWILINDNPTNTGGKVVLYTDVTELKRRERHIEHIAHHDALTGLPNRVLFRKKLEEALDRGQQSGSEIAVIYIDLDRFKAVNDTLGHPIGDALLQIVGKRIQECLRPSDVAARLGGDEFAAVITEGANTEMLTSLAWRLIDLLSRPAMIEGQAVVVGASLGIAIGHDGSASADYLLKSADLAVYRAKSDGRATFRFFEAEMDAIAQERRTLEMDLRAAVKLGQLKVYYQPQVDVFTSQIVGAEALLRWHHPVRGNIPPSDFIPLAEETGLMIEIGPWVLRQACMDAVQWPYNTLVAVNCSPVQFQDGAFVETVKAILEETGLKPSRLEIEITESLLIRDTDKNLKTLWGLKQLGVRVSMDDFGTGYSSLGNLRSFPFDKIKIDRSFVSDLKNSVDAAAIIRAVLGLGRSLGITTTAEGVETRDQLAYLRAEGCSEVQGFYYSEARPHDVIRDILLASPTGVINPR